MSDYRFRMIALAAAASLLPALTAQTRIDLRTQAKSVDFSGAQTTKPFRTGTALPGSCSMGEAFFQTTAPAGENLYGCTATDTWTLLSANSIGGDVSGSLSSAQVIALRGRAVSATAPADGQILAWNASLSRWEPAANGSAASRFLAGTSLPGTCSTGDAFFNTAAVAGANLFGCTTPNVWTQMTPSLSGDVSGTYSMTQVVGLRGRTLSSATPASGQVLTWNGTSSQWEPGNAASTGGGITGVTGSTAAKPIISTTTNGIVAAGSTTGNTSVFVTGTSASISLGHIGVFDVDHNLVDGGVPKNRVCTVERTSSTILTFAPAATSSTPCNIPVYGSAPISITAPITSTITAGNGTSWVGIDNPSGTVKVYNNGPTSTCSGTCTISTTGGNPPDTFAHIWKWTATSGTWDASGGTDEAGEAPAPPTISAGTGTAMTASGNQVTIAVDTSVTPQKLIGSALIDFASIAAQTCATNTITVPGATAGGYVAPGWPSALTANLSGTMYVSSSNTITVQLCNPTGSPIDPASLTFSAMVLQ